MNQKIDINRILEMFFYEHQINYTDSLLTEFCKEAPINHAEFIRDDSGYIYVDGEEGDHGFIHYYTKNNELICIETVDEDCPEYHFSRIGHYMLGYLATEYIRFQFFKWEDHNEFALDSRLANKEISQNG